MADTSYKSPFDFSDEYGNDPILRKYGRYGDVKAGDLQSAQAATSAAAARRQLAEANLAYAQAELNAKLAPMKAQAEVIASMSNLYTQKTNLEKDARMRKDSANLAAGLNGVQNLEGLRDLISANSFGMDDEQTAKLVTERAASLYRASADNATSTFDVDKNFSLLPTSVASRTEMINLHKNLFDMAGRREKVLTGGAEIKLPFSPVTSEGELDIPRGEQLIAAEKTKKALEKEAQSEAEKRIDNIRQSYGIVSRRLAETLPGAEPDPQLLALKNSLETQLIEYSKSLIPGAGMPPSDGTQPTGGTGKSDWTADLVPPGVTVPSSKSAVQDGVNTVPPTATEPVPTDSQVPTTPTPTPTEQTTAAAQAPVVSKTKTAKELIAAQKRVDTLTKELDAMKKDSGLEKQPWGIRQINEALSSDNAEIRAKARELRQAQLEINPLIDADTNNAQDVAAALKLVYPEIGDGLTPKFDVGNPKDNRVMAAAMFLQKVRPEFLRMVASSPGVARGGLSLKEIKDIVENQPITTRKRTTRK